MEPRIVLLDIETAPSLGWIWGKYEQNVIDFKTNWYLLSFAYKFLGESKVHVRALPDYPTYKKDRESDAGLIKDLWAILDGADIVIGHNLDAFDIRRTNARFLTHRLNPPTPYKTVDTLKIARRVFKFDSNKLDDLGGYLGLGRKLPHTGFHLWKGCMFGDAKSWKVMKKYNMRDIILLEDVYHLLRPWATNHPNVNKGEFACPKCSSVDIQKRGFSYTLSRKKQRFQCNKCHGWFEGPAAK